MEYIHKSSKKNIIHYDQDLFDRVSALCKMPTDKLNPPNFLQDFHLLHAHGDWPIHLQSISVRQ